MAATDPVILVTGSSGLIGFPLCERLEAAGYRTFGLDRPGLPHPPDLAEAVDCDLADDQSVRSAMKQVRQDGGPRIASVVHLAAYYDFSGEPSPLYENVTVRGTERLLNELGSFDVEQFVFSSTMLVHAPCAPTQRISEDWPLDPKWDYPRSKVDTERLILARRGRVPAVLLRIAGVYDDECRALPLAQQVQRIHERKLTGKVFPGDVLRGQSFVHLDDLLDAIVRVVDRRKELPPELPLLIGEPETLSYDELQRTFAWQIHQDPNWDTTQIPKALAKAGAWVQDQAWRDEESFIKPWM
ncbi:MAG: NAD-dependent epimerase/dehydratase family protein, partial [Tepidisphaeraceae bacterium]